MMMRRRRRRKKEEEEEAGERRNGRHGRWKQWPAFHDGRACRERKI